MIGWIVLDGKLNGFGFGGFGGGFGNNCGFGGFGQMTCGFGGGVGGFGAFGAVNGAPAPTAGDPAPELRQIGGSLAVKLTFGGQAVTLTGVPLTSRSPVLP